MDIALVLMREIGMMALLICLGVFTKKRGMLTDGAAKQLAGLLLAIVFPVMLVNTLQRDKTPELMGGFWASMAISAGILALSAVIAMLVFRAKDDGRYKIERIAVAMPNCGFMGIPLLKVTTGEESLLYCAVVMGVFQLLVWCWAIPVINGSRPTVKSVLINPGTTAFLVGMALFLLEIRLPVVMLSFMSQISGLNTPVSMIMIGVFLADIKLRDAFLSPNVYGVVFLRNLAIPLLSLAVIYAFGLTALFGEMLSLTLLILLACPCAASVLLLPLRNGEESPYAARVIAVSTLFSIVTLPFVAFVAERVLK